MNFKLPRQILNKEVTKIISTEVRKQRIYVERANKEDLKEIAQVARAIRKKGLPHHFVRRKLPKGLGYGIFLHPKAVPILKGRLSPPTRARYFLSPKMSRKIRCMPLSPSVMSCSAKSCNLGMIVKGPTTPAVYTLFRSMA